VLRKMSWTRRRREEEGIAGPGHSLDHWLPKLDNELRDLRSRLLKDLEKSGTLVLAEQPIASLALLNRRWNVDETVARHLRERLRFELLEAEEPTVWTVALASLVLVSRLLPALFSIFERWKVEPRIRKLVADVPMTAAVFNALIDWQQDQEQARLKARTATEG
jgi:hypothetical protein